jgi:methionine-rich copper-binding protein CopC
MSKIQLLLVCLLSALPLNGHAVLRESIPRLHSFVSGPDIQIRLRFNSRIDAAHSHVVLSGTSRRQQVELAAQDAPDTLAGQAKHVVAGEYRIEWQVLAIDGHITRGEVPFTVQ